MAFFLIEPGLGLRIPLKAARKQSLPINPRGAALHMELQDTGISFVFQECRYSGKSNLLPPEKVSKHVVQTLGC